MRTLREAALLCALMWAFVSAWAQDTETDDTTSLPEIADLEPAVDVSDLPEARIGDAASRDRAMDTLNLGTTSVIGSQELPKVLYIVPWKSSDLGDLVGRPVNTLLDEVLAPIDPEEFERHLEYYDALFMEGDKE
ncbi:MAG TPA: hypothetical protein VIV14_02565 [Gammaproteobacteria bacterium]